MVDYVFYADVYLGTAIPEKAFSGMALRAEEALERMQRIFRVTVPGEESRKMAVCAMAESLYAHSRRKGGVISASSGEVSVRYEGAGQADRQLSRELYEKAAIYLEISRGVGV